METGRNWVINSRNYPECARAPLTSLAVIDTATNIAVPTELTAAPGETVQNLMLSKHSNRDTIAVRRDGSYFMRFSIDAAGNFYVNDFQTNTISKIDEDGQLSSYLDLMLSSSKRVQSFFVDEDGGVTHLNRESGGFSANHSIDHKDIDGTQTRYVFYRFVGGTGDDFSADRIPFGHTVEFIPEPSSLVLAGCGAVSLGVLAIGRARRKRRGYKV